MYPYILNYDMKEGQAAVVDRRHVRDPCGEGHLLAQDVADLARLT